MFAAYKPAQTLSVYDEEDEENRICAIILSARVLSGIDRVAKLEEASAEILASSLTDPSKLEVLDRCAAQTVQALSDLSGDFLVTTLPFSENQEVMVKRVIDLTEELDAQYAEIELDQRGVDHKLVLHRRTNLLLEQLTFTAACYVPWVAQLWTRLHRLYISALNYSAASFESPMLDSRHDVVCIEHLYVTAILTAEADPYQIPFRDIHKARELAFAFADQVNVTYVNQKVQAASGHHRLLIDDRVDTPSLLYRVGKTLDHHNVILELENCYQTLSQRLDNLQQDAHSKDPLFPEAGRDTILGIYRHVLVKWGVQQTRFSTRVVENVDYDLVINYPNVVNTFFSPAASGLVNKIDSNRCIVATSTDTSETGVGLKIPTSPGLVIQVGELIAMRAQANDDDDWRLVVVRWLRKSRRGLIDIGTMKVPGRMYSGQLTEILSITNKNSQSVGPDSTLTTTQQEPLPVLVTTTEETDAGMTAQLLVHKTIKNRNRTHWLSYGGTHRKIETMQPFLGTRHLMIYTCQLAEPGELPINTQD